MAGLTEWLHRIETEHRQHRPRGLDRVKVLLRTLDLQKPAEKIVIVAGTNGKGTTVSYMERMLLDAGYSVGATASPHLHQYNERIRLNGKPVPDKAIVGAFSRIESVRSTPLTYFEWATLAALYLFCEEGIERALLEVGLGGRLDTTNTLDPDISVITSIGIDHTHILGPDRETIGTEKAGILRAGTPCVYGDRHPVRSVLLAAGTLQSPLLLYNREFGYSRCSPRLQKIYVTLDKKQEFKLPSPPQVSDSAATALQTVGLLEDRVDPSFVQTLTHHKIPGRKELVEFRDRSFLLDVAHNPDAFKSLGHFIRENFESRTLFLLFGCLRDKDASGMLNAIEVEQERIVIIDTTGNRGRTSTEVLSELKLNGPRSIPQLKFALDYIVEQSEPLDLILVSGSFQVVGRVRDLIQQGIGSQR